MANRKKMKDAYKHTLAARRSEPAYQEHLARGRRMTCGGVPLEALSRKDLMSLLSYTAGVILRRKK